MAVPERKTAIKNADMAEEMQQDAVDCATQVDTFIQNICGGWDKLSCWWLLTGGGDEREVQWERFWNSYIFTFPCDLWLSYIM